MTNFSKQALMQNTSYIIQNLDDIDFYKLTMCYYIFKHNRGMNVRFDLINRKKEIKLGEFINERELREQLDHVRTLAWRKTTLYYLRGMDLYDEYMFDNEFIKFLENLVMSGYELFKRDGQWVLRFEGPWEVVTFWELYALPIVNELYARYFLRQMSNIDLERMYARATDKLARKLERIKNEAPHAKIADFGQRRRHSFLWQAHAIELCMDILGDQFVGTSNVHMAQKYDIAPIGTNAHELPMALTAAAKGREAKKNAQYEVIRKWDKLYSGALSVALTDTYGTHQFFNDMPDDVKEIIARSWSMRQDSGDPAEEARFFMSKLREFGVSDEEIKNRRCIFSDGLDVDNIISLSNQFHGDLITPFGWGTKLTNDFIDCLPNANEVVPGTGRSFGSLFVPFSLVCKVAEADGQPAVKLSNNVNKATGLPEEVEEYKQIFGVDGVGEQKVEV